jgi:hypothetical protein
VEKSGPKILATTEIFNKLPNQSIGENSPNLVTLLGTQMGGVGLGVQVIRQKKCYSTGRT